MKIQESRLTVFFITVLAICVTSVIFISEQKMLLSPYYRGMEGAVAFQVRQAEFQVSRQDLQASPIPSASSRFSEEKPKGIAATSPVGEEKPQGRSASSLGRSDSSLGRSTSSLVSKNEARRRPTPFSVEEPLEKQTTSLVNMMRAGKLMRKRAAHMSSVCGMPSVRLRVPTRPWASKRYTLPRPFPVCVAPKVGSTTWRRFMFQFGLSLPRLRQDLKTLVVRHPLARLASAYRDKFLNGSPLNAYNETFRTITGSGETWQCRWELYWLPSLVRRGLVKPPPEFFITIRETSQAFEYLAKNFVDTSGNLHWSEASNTSQSYSQQALKTAINMLTRSKQQGMVAAVTAGFSKMEQAKLQRLFSNASFTMTEFLEHVLWTRNLGMVDQHWAPISELCDPCRANYTYVLHLENPEESDYLLSRLHIFGNSLRTRHKSIRASPDQSESDLRYYENVPKDLVTKIHDMYKLEFELFGYDKYLI